MRFVDTVVGYFQKLEAFLFQRKKEPILRTQFDEAKIGTTVIEMRGITKRFGNFVANDDIDFDIKAGEVHALLGENGAGKTTLMNILYGLIQPDEGEIYVMGKKVELRSPKDAINLGIGMVHQHFMLVPTFSVIENVVLGLKSSREPLLDIDQAEEKLAEFSRKYGLEVDPKAKVWQLSVGEQQRIEIIKALYRGARVLILDEPTAVLTPQEVGELVVVLKNMTKEGLAVVPFITHKLPEVMAISDRVTVLRRGKVIASMDTNRTTEAELARRMVGRDVLFNYAKAEVKLGKPVLEVNNLQTLNDNGSLALKGITFLLREGEILGVAGVSGNGQRELAEVLSGLRKATEGKVIIDGQDVTNCSPKETMKAGLSHVCEDRIGSGAILDLSIAENLVLGCCNEPPFAAGRLPLIGPIFLNYGEVKRHGEKLSLEYSIIAPSLDSQAKNLSGGNLQRLILARELSKHPHILVAAQPTRGLDVGATEYIRQTILKQRESGTAILLISESLDEIMSLSDRIIVLYEGEIVGETPAAKASFEEIGQMMAGMRHQTTNAVIQ